MKTVIQRVSEASVETDSISARTIGAGLVALAAIVTDDTAKDRDWTAQKIAHLRVFPDGEGKMNKSVLEAGGSVLLISNFTVAGDASRGRRPSFDLAMKPPQAREAFEALAESLRGLGVPVVTGEFGVHMRVRLVNDGPVTIVLDSALARPAGA